MGEMICVCREIDKYTGEIAVYPIKAEVTDRLLFCLGLRQRANPELKYFVTLAENYDANEETILKQLCYLFRRGRIRSIFTITYTGKRKSGSFAGGFASQTTKGTRAIPRPSLLW